jgi:hypothetical protein
MQHGATVKKDATNLIFIHIHNINMFRASLCPSPGEDSHEDGHNDARL